MTITTYVCDLCREEIPKKSEQSSFDYYLPFTEEKDGGVTIRPRRHNLCEMCATLIKEECIKLKANAMISK